MRIRTILASFFYLLMGCEVSVATVNLTEPAISEQVNAITSGPVDPAETFAASTGDLNATVLLSAAGEDISVRAIFYLLAGAKTEIANLSMVASGTRYMNFTLSPPPSGWPEGAYQVDFYLGEELKESLSFSIASETDANTSTDPEPTETMVADEQTPPVDIPTAQAVPGFRAFQDAQFGFGFELPDNWDFQVIGERNDYLFKGPADSEEGQILIIVQMMDSRQGAATTLKDEMLNQLGQFEQMQGVEILKKDEFQLADTRAPYFLMTYPSENQQGESVIWGHTQMGVENEPILLLISYSAPRAIYQDKIDIFQHMMDSFVLSTPE